MSKIVTGFLLIIIFSSIYFFLYSSGLDVDLFNSKNLQSLLVKLNSVGPLLIILLMTGAIVMSPLPSAPIAIASGYVYGHSWGTLYIVIGAETGALVAFTIARLLGYEAIQKRFGNKINATWLDSSNNLMWVIFISRMIPFISFDIVSYASGLTKISYLRFAIATFAGILPVSFLLAHFGSEIVSNDIKSIMLTIVLLGFMTVIPLIFSIVKKRK